MTTPIISLRRARSRAAVERAVPLLRRIHQARPDLLRQPLPGPVRPWAETRGGLANMITRALRTLGDASRADEELLDALGTPTGALLFWATAIYPIEHRAAVARNRQIAAAVLAEVRADPEANTEVEAAARVTADFAPSARRGHPAVDPLFLSIARIATIPIVCYAQPRPWTLLSPELRSLIYGIAEAGAGGEPARRRDTRSRYIARFVLASPKECWREYQAALEEFVTACRFAGPDGTEAVRRAAAEDGVDATQRLARSDAVAAGLQLDEESLAESVCFEIANGDFPSGKRGVAALAVKVAAPEADARHAFDHLRKIGAVDQIGGRLRACFPVDPRDYGLDPREVTRE